MRDWIFAGIVGAVAVGIVALIGSDLTEAQSFGAIIGICVLVGVAVAYAQSNR